MRAKFTRSSVILAGMMFINGCAVPKRAFYVNPVAGTTQKIAVLPMNNFTTDLDGPDVVRPIAVKTLQSCGKTLPELEYVDETLRGIGVTDGGQLPAFNPKMLGEKLGVDAMLYGELEAFNYVNLGYYQKRSVGVHFWLVDTVTGEKLWEDTASEVTSNVAASKEDAKEAFAAGVLEKWAEKALKSSLYPESVTAVVKTFSSFPGCGFVRYQEWAQVRRPRRIKRQAKVKKIHKEAGKNAHKN